MMANSANMVAKKQVLLNRIEVTSLRVREELLNEICCQYFLFASSVYRYEKEWTLIPFCGFQVLICLFVY